MEWQIAHGLEVDIHIRVRGSDIFIQASGIEAPSMYMLLDMLVSKYRLKEHLDITEAVSDN